MLDSIIGIVFFIIAHNYNSTNALFNAHDLSHDCKNEISTKNAKNKTNKKKAKNWWMTESRISFKVDFWMNSVILRLIQWFSKSALLREILICITMTDTLLPKCLLFIMAYGNISAFKYLLSEANAFSVLRDNFLCLAKWHVAKIHMTPNKMGVVKKTQASHTV